MKKPLPRPQKRELTKVVPPGKQKAMFDQLSAQVDTLAARLEALRAQGADKSPEFKQLEALLYSVQDKLLLAQAKLR